MAMNNMKRPHGDNTTTHHNQHQQHQQHHAHNHHQDTAFSQGQLTTFSSDPAISFMSQTATNTNNPYSQSLDTILHRPSLATGTLILAQIAWCHVIM